jgi:hypothetical protein
MIELVHLLLAALAGAVHSRQRLLLENLLLRQQLQVALRSRRRPRFHARDKLFCSGSSSVASTGTGDATSSWSGPPCSAGIARAGACSGAGAPAVLWADRA